MFPVLTFNETELLCFILVLIRVSAFVVAWPVFSVFSVPNHAKILLALCICFVVFPIIDKTGLKGTELGPDIAWLSLGEALIGLCLGFITRMFFFAISIGGNMASTAMGLGNGQVFNPTLNMQSTTYEQFFVCLATLLFLAINGHHLFLTGLTESFSAIPLSWQSANVAIFKESGTLVQQVTVAGLKLSAPVVVALFLVNVAMGIIGRAVPQINVLVTSLPVNIIVGLGVTILMLPVFLSEAGSMLNLMAEQLFLVIKGL